MEFGQTASQVFAAGPCVPESDDVDGFRVGMHFDPIVQRKSPSNLHSKGFLHFDQADSCSVDRAFCRLLLHFSIYFRVAAEAMNPDVRNPTGTP